MAQLEFSCLLCHGKKHQLIKEHTRDSKHHVVQCLSCGLQQLFPLPTVEEDANYYNLNEHDKKITPDYKIEDIYRKFEYQNKSRIEYLKKFGIYKNWNMLDYGCGYGFFIEMMESEGFEFDGVEISEDRLNVCKERLGGAVYNRIYKINLLAEEVPDELIEHYDLITMFHLLEHIIDPRLMLNKIIALLKVNGYLVIEVPNVANKMMEASAAFNDFFYIRDHVAYYTPDLLKDLLESLNLKVILARGNQVYGLTNHMNWIINGKPEFTNPSYESCEAMRWIEEIYKDTLNNEMKSEYMYMIAKKIKIDI